jgi:competence protein ComFC
VSIWSRILDLLFPPRCPFCGKIQDAAGVCPGCAKTLPWTEQGQREQTLSGGTRCVSPLWYEDAARDGILRYKFSGASGAADTLGGLLADCAAENFSGEFDCVTWVPVSRKRLRKRGYDQAFLLAEAACRRWNTKPERMLRKPEDNPAQSGLKGAAARRANVLGVYEPVNPDKIRERRILLVDDIVTTGSTLGECARVLRDAGAKEVLCVTLARTRGSAQPVK